MQTALTLKLSLCRLRRSTHRYHSVFNHSRSTPSVLSHPAYSRKMSSFTLKDLKVSEWWEHPMSSTAFSMKKTGFHRWGFPIYRTTYDDDAAWERYLEVLKLTARHSLDDQGCDVLLEQYMDCRRNTPAKFKCTIKSPTETSSDTFHH